MSSGLSRLSSNAFSLLMVDLKCVDSDTSSENSSWRVIITQRRGSSGNLVAGDLKTSRRCSLVVLFRMLPIPLGATYAWWPLAASVLERIVIVIMVLLVPIYATGEPNDPVTAGSCWVMVASNSAGLRCQGFLRTSVSKEQCCQSAGLTFGWSAHDSPSMGQLFYWRALSGGAPQCEPCQETCSKVVCPQNKKCQMRNNRPRCICAPDCTPHRHQGVVCGMDRRTYRSHCSLLKYNCRRDRNVDVDYSGPCRHSCSEVHCPRGLNCVQDQNGLPHCIHCQSHCPTVSGSLGNKFCGADGITYESFCRFKRATCLHGRSIGIAYMGECQGDFTCANLSCSGGRRCLIQPSSGRPQCVTCDTQCNAYVGSHTLCGSNNVTYPGWCSMRQAACGSGLVINTKHYGTCNGLSIQADDYNYYEDYGGDHTSGDTING